MCFPLLRTRCVGLRYHWSFGLDCGLVCGQGREEVRFFEPAKPQFGRKSLVLVVDIYDIYDIVDIIESEHRHIGDAGQSKTRGNNWARGRECVGRRRVSERSVFFGVLVWSTLTPSSSLPPLALFPNPLALLL